MPTAFPSLPVAPFPLGRMVATPGALVALERLGCSPLLLFRRHVMGDWGELCAEDKDANVRALADEARVLSRYVLGNVAFYVITEADRSRTTLLLPEEY